MSRQRWQSTRQWPGSWPVICSTAFTSLRSSQSCPPSPWVHWIVIESEQADIDPSVLLILKGVSYMLVVLDAVGVVTVTGLLTYRFIRFNDEVR